MCSAPYRGYPRRDLGLRANAGAPLSRTIVLIYALTFAAAVLLQGIVPVLLYRGFLRAADASAPAYASRTDSVPRPG